MNILLKIVLAVCVITPHIYRTVLYLNDYFRLQKNGILINGLMIQKGLVVGYGMNIPIMKYQFNGKNYQNKVRFTYLTILPRKIGVTYEILIDPEKPHICMFSSKTVVNVLIFNQTLFLFGVIMFLLFV